MNMIEFLLRINFLVLTLFWINRIMVLRSDKQVIINPTLMGIAALMIVIPTKMAGIEILGMSAIELKVLLYCSYCTVVIFGMYVVKRKDTLF